MTYPVFVGSTFIDLEQYREAVRHALHRQEVAVRGMEYFGSLPSTPKEECLRKVRSCRFYVGIFAMRYGTIDPETGLSLTHLEYNEAQRIGLPSLIYLIDEERQAVLPRFVDFGESAQKLRDLKEELRRNHVVSPFTTPDDLAAKVTIDLLGLVARTEGAAPAVPQPVRHDSGSQELIVPQGSKVILDSFSQEEFLAHLSDEEVFHWRISDAFPGTSGLVIIDDPCAALHRLDVLLRHPIEKLSRESQGNRNIYHPFYWYRGGRTMEVDHYSRLDDERCLIGMKQLWISRIAAFRSSSHSREFLYIESKAEEPTGVYQYAPGEIAAKRPWGNFFDEEYGIWNDRFVTAAEYEDRAAVIDGRPVWLQGAELRTRYLTPYNFILATRRHVINSNKLDSLLESILDGILLRQLSLENLIAVVESLPPLPLLNDWD